eukprot:1183107-Prorocentrum_minimum.AAC.1
MSTVTFASVLGSDWSVVRIYPLFLRLIGPGPSGRRVAAAARAGAERPGGGGHPEPLAGAADEAPAGRAPAGGGAGAVVPAHVVGPARGVRPARGGHCRGHEPLALREGQVRAREAEAREAAKGGRGGQAPRTQREERKPGGVLPQPDDEPDAPRSDAPDRTIRRADEPAAPNGVALRGTGLNSGGGGVTDGGCCRRRRARPGAVCRRRHPARLAGLRGARAPGQEAGGGAHGGAVVALALAAPGAQTPAGGVRGDSPVLAGVPAETASAQEPGGGARDSDALAGCPGAGPGAGDGGRERAPPGGVARQPGEGSAAAAAGGGSARAAGVEEEANV